MKFVLKHYFGGHIRSTGWLLGMVINLKFANTGTFLGLAVLMFLRPVGTAPRAIQIAGTVVGSSLVSGCI